MPSISLLITALTGCGKTFCFGNTFKYSLYNLSGLFIIPLYKSIKWIESIKGSCGSPDNGISNNSKPCINDKGLFLSSLTNCARTADKSIAFLVRTFKMSLSAACVYKNGEN